MDFKRIFTKDKNCKLWSICYPENEKNGKPRDIFRILLKQWENIEYLDKFFSENEEVLNRYWGLTIDQAFNKVELESLRYQLQLSAVVNKKEGYENIEIKDLFAKLHTSTTSLITSNESHRKGKPELKEPFLRLYGVELEDGTIIITGGGIKLYDTMQASGLSDELTKMKRVQKYLNQEGITTKEGLE